MRLKGLKIHSNIRNNRFNSLLFQYFMIIAAIVIIPMSILSFVYYRYYNQSLTQELESSNKHTALKVRDITDMVFSETQQLLTQIRIIRTYQCHNIFYTVIFHNCAVAVVLL